MMATIIIDYQNCFIFIFLCFFSLLCYTLFFRKQKNFPLPPSPPSLPIIGHLDLLLSVLAHRSLQKLSSKYGSILYLRIFSSPIVLVSSASVAYEIFRAHDVNISSRGLPPTEDSLFAGSFSFISAPYGDYWKFMKKVLVTNLLGPQALKRSRRVRADELDRFYDNLFEKAAKKETVEIFAEALKLVNDNICKLIMGRCCSEEEDVVERVKGLAIKLDVSSRNILLANLLPPWLKKLVLSLFKKEVKTISNSFDELLEKILAEHEEKLGEHHQGKDLMDVLLAAYGDENAEYKITRNHIKSFYVDLLFAGITNSALPIQWTLAEIINSPNSLERLRGELDSVVGTTRLIQETDLPNLPYLQAVVKEGLRLHPPEPMFERFSQEGCKVGGFYVPEKTSLMVNAYAVMRDPNYWADPDEFKPERFLDTWQEEERREQALKYIPFGSGRRGCPGENLAHIFIGTAIGVMVQGFEWRFKEEKVNMEEAVAGLSLTMAHPLKCTPVARTLNPLTSRGGF
ncbi:PREDICTED: cytochrome P450 705A5-like [Brassica oleracea var. oleracea]|uniref:Cytochrome P450 n=1 Tax=Brassica oleracea var. oleracea TaxID=109376 RepID=A0A0D3BCB3_BRAOL|nr:PREDICTED: cytochrome P450 705A5-like [Brassica oleracea var. oleracea]